ncbi:MAG TPA: hotdog fold thioesterase [Stellaceae bacterium]|nr:hotdog fold thioesterase [Stellaceae bacterium]
MPIWFDEAPLAYARERAAQSMIGHLGIEVIEAGDDYLKARMSVDHRTKQPAGVLHGGASVALAETLASWGAAFCVDRSKHHCVGLEINAKSSPSGVRRNGHGHRSPDPPRAHHPRLGNPHHRRARQARLRRADHHGGARDSDAVLARRLAT